MARLLRAEEVARAANFQVTHGDLEPGVELGKLADGGQALFGDLRERLVRAVEQIRARAPRAASDAPAQLVELGKAELVGVLHDEGVDVRDIDAGLDDRRADEHLNFSLDHVVHDAGELFLVHFAVRHADGNTAAELLLQLPGVDKINAAYELAEGFTTIQSVLHIVSVAVIAVLLVFHIPYESYWQGGELINLFLGPATACMAVTIYSQRKLLAKHWLPVLVGCVVGVVTAMGSILVLCRLLGLDRAMTMSLLPKSVTMPIATVVAQGHGGTVAVTVAAVVVTGMLGNLCAPLLVKLFRVKDPMAVGLGIGACSHAMGTAKALELGETEGAMSGLAIGLCGILTTVLALLADFFVI